MEPRTRFSMIYIVVAALLFLALQFFASDRLAARVVPYSEFQELLRDGKVERVLIEGDALHGTLAEAVEGTKHFVTTRVEPALAESLTQAKVKFAQRPEQVGLAEILPWLCPAFAVFGLWYLLSQRFRGGLGGGLMTIGKSKAKVYVEADTRVSFADVAGVDEAKAELREVVEFLKAPERYARLGARMPKGVLLIGPPGTGKTLLARAVAGEAGVPFLSINGSEFVEMFVGVGAARTRDLFEQARGLAPCIIFIDELDALGRARHTSGQLGGHDEKEQTLNQLLVELDGFDSRSGVVLLAATNRPEILDPALLRAGRFDRQVLVDRPDRLGREAIIAVHAKKIVLAPDVAPDAIAALTPGFTGADLENLVNEAALAATRRDGVAVEMRDFTLAIERIVAGLEKRNRLLNPLEQRVVAFHEMGHALVARALPGSDTVHKISIVPRGVGALGYTMQRPTEERYLMTRAELEKKLAVFLGGRAAEHIVFDHFSSGAADDLARATELARNMATRYAMIPALGHVSYDAETPSLLGGGSAPNLLQRSYSEATAREIDEAIRVLTADAFERACRLLARNRAVLEEGAALLLERETLEEDALRRLFEHVAGEPATRSGIEGVAS